MIGNDISAEFSTSIVSTLKKTMTIGELWNFCTPKLTKHTTNAHNSLVNAGTLILDPSEHLLNLYYSIKVCTCLLYNVICSRYSYSYVITLNIIAT